MSVEEDFLSTPRAGPPNVSSSSSPPRRALGQLQVRQEIALISRTSDDDGRDDHHADQEAEGRVLRAQRVTHEERLEDVDRRVDDDPHHVDEVPVDPRHLHAAVLLLGEVPAEGADRREQQQGQADEDVGTVQPGQPVEDRALRVLARAKPMLMYSLIWTVRKVAPSRERGEQAGLQREAILVPARRAAPSAS